MRNLKEMFKAKKDFIKVIVAYLIYVIAIALILPINMKWGYVALILIGIGSVLQWYWNKHFKE